MGSSPVGSGIAFAGYSLWDTVVFTSQSRQEQGQFLEQRIFHSEIDRGGQSLGLCFSCYVTKAIGGFPWVFFHLPLTIQAHLRAPHLLTRVLHPDLDMCNGHPFACAIASEQEEFHAAPVLAGWKGLRQKCPRSRRKWHQIGNCQLKSQLVYTSTEFQLVCPTTHTHNPLFSHIIFLCHYSGLCSQCVRSKKQLFESPFTWHLHPYFRLLPKMKACYKHRVLLPWSTHPITSSGGDQMADGTTPDHHGVAGDKPGEFRSTIRSSARG